MKKIILMCAGGASTGMLAKKMSQAAKKLGLDYEISAHGVADAVEVASDADFVLLGPQVAYQLADIKAELPDVQNVEAIDMMDYGMMNADKILDGVADKIVG